jgi:putative ABC transport system permease protein
VKLALKMLGRDWRGGELQLLFACLVLAVATVSGITHFSSTLQASLMQQSKDFLAGSMVLSSPRPVPQEWLQEAQQRDIRVSQNVGMASMAFANEKMQLASLKAVSDGYPLRGALRISQSAFSAQSDIVTHVPKAGEAWLASSMASLLDVMPGDTIEIGKTRLVFSKILVDEPDRGFAMFSVGPRVMIHLDDLAAADLILPGSRVSYRYQFDADDASMARFKSWLEPQLEESHRIRTLDDAQPRLAEALQRAERFLLLAGSLAVMLSGLAIAMSAQRYCQRHYDHVAILKTLGMTESRVLGLFATSLLLLALLASIFGGLAGWGLKTLFEQVFAEYLVDVVDVSLWRPWLFGLATALVSLLAFAWPPLRALQKTSAMAVLRDLVPVDPLSQGLRIVIAGLGSVALLMIYTQSWFLSLGLLGGLAALALVVGLLARGLLAVRRGVGRLASPLGLAWANLQRHRRHTQLQLMVYSSALMLVGLLWAVRSDLLDDWRASLPADTPNHFMVNVAEYEVDTLKQQLVAAGVNTETIYPMVRGRLTHINGESVLTQVTKEEQRSIDRELNLTWNDTLPPKNIVEQGEWWQGDGSDGVSIESRLADRLGLTLGDSLRFQVGADVLDTYIQSIRSLDWQQMRPNFYFIFPPGQLNSYPATYITSVYLGPAQKSMLTGLMREFPTVTIIEMDLIIAQINSTVDRVSQAIEIVFGLVLLATAAVLVASILASQRERRRDNALLRTMGATSPLLWRACGWEFILLGLAANVIACFGAELSLAAIQSQLLGIAPSIHWQLWWALPAISVPVLVFIGIASSKASLYEPPVVLLRDS